MVLEPHFYDFCVLHLHHSHANLDGWPSCSQLIIAPAGRGTRPWIVETKAHEQVFLTSCGFKNREGVYTKRLVHPDMKSSSQCFSFHHLRHRRLMVTVTQFYDMKSTSHCFSFHHVRHQRLTVTVTQFYENKLHTRGTYKTYQ
jgi:hypothetical protein